MRSLIEIIQNKFILIIILSTIIRAQYPCSCSCCVGSNCQSCIISYAYAPSCTATSCLQVCSARYYQCAANAPYGQASGTCLSATTITPLSGPYSCRCDCCNLNSSSSCAPALVGYTTAYSCSTGSCSISCNSQYPLLCVSNQNGQTQGTCQGPSMTTTSTTTTGAWLGNACSCYCCQSGPYCLPTINVGNTSSPYCSMYACTQACQAQYPSLCPSTPYFGRTNVLYFYVKRAFFTLYGSIPGLQPQFIVGNLLQTGIIGQNAPMNIVFLKLKAKFGDIFQFWLGSTRIIVVNCLEDAQHIFTHRQIYDQGDIFVEKLGLVNPNAVLCLRGAKFKRHASIVSPLFRGNKINVHLDAILDCTDKLLMRWRTYNNDLGQVHLNMIEQCQQLTLAIFGVIAFDFDLQTLEDENNSGKNELTRALYIHLEAAMKLIQLPTIIGRIYLFLNPVYRQARTIIDRYLQRMIEQELQESSMVRAERKRTSLIASLVTSLQQDERAEALKTEETKKGLSRAEVMGEMLSFLSAGYSTTAAALVWFIYFMSKYPQVQAKIKRELANYHFQRLSVEDLESLTYLDCVFRELFRLVPPAIGTARTLVMDDRLPATGANLNKGDQVFISFYNLARDSRYWSESIDPEIFDPERFSNDNIKYNNAAASIPFGGGHRQCMGQDLARLELKSICARFMQYVTFGDGGPLLNAGGFKQTDTILPKHIGVTIHVD
ncbi:unnamed protein product [Rotaria socialis]|uniref:Cytochrome P450 n=1 Tax=Rotaria socialis TaxID=392032 RepID=A0A819YEA3_9BILA|nr:unnamed protein product [Rotaria socialis]CAF4154830.1 unnamed protein product [Rotaria socialis]CAF4436176.1 unnamed protein product [Rotaria socialis]CAF4704391.1 unnamed protein product [Rotaria socialis]